MWKEETKKEEEAAPTVRVEGLFVAGSFLHDSRSKKESVDCEGLFLLIVETEEDAEEMVGRKGVRE